MMQQPRFSVVIPTYQRRDVAVENVAALGRQTFPGPFEVIVVVDGSTDGTAGAVAALETRFPLTVVEQENLGLGSARNRGASEAAGELLLFLDDDMEAAPGLLAEHDRSHREGADVVLGHVPLHPESPRNFLTAAVGEWADTRGRKLSAPDAALALHDLICGQMSIRRDLFMRLGGFDTAFNRGGAFGNEDLDLGRRLVAHGLRVVFDVDAVSYQRYVVSPRRYLQQWREAGRADVLLARKHPEEIETIAAARTETPVDRFVLRWLRVPARAGVLALARIAPSAHTTSRLFFRVRDLEYFEGIRDAGGMPGRHRVRILCYHALTDLVGAPVMEQYGMPPARFAEHVDVLSRHFRFIGAEEFLRFLDGGGVPRRALLLTFDDCYRDLVETGLPFLRSRGIPALAFAVTQRIGGTNDWDAHLGAAQLPLASAEELRALAADGVAIASHTRTHRMLNTLDAGELDDELAGSRRDLEALAIPALPVLAYPHGEYDEAVAAAAQRAGYAAAFTVEAGLVDADDNRYALRRIEVSRSDCGRRFLWKLLRGGR